MVWGCKKLEEFELIIKHYSYLLEQFTATAEDKIQIQEDKNCQVAKILSSSVLRKESLVFE